MPSSLRRQRVAPLLGLLLVLPLAGQAAASATPTPSLAIASTTTTPIAALTERFESGLDPTVWSDVHGPAVVAEGRLRIAADRSYGHVRTEARYDLRNGALTVEVPQVPTAGSGETHLIIGPDGANQVSIIQSGSSVLFRSTVEGVVASPGAEAYDADQHRWWRIRQDGLVTHWETSADARSWATHRSAALGLDLSSTSVQLRAGHWAPETTPGGAVFDNVNVLPGAAVTLDDDFDLGLDPARWTDVKEPAQVAAGKLRIPAVRSYGHMRTGASFDLTGAHAAVEVTKVPTASSGETFLVIGADDRNRVSVVQSGKKLNFQAVVAGTVTTKGSVSYSASAHRWWRIREAGGKVFWETSPDASTWTVRRSAALPIDLRSSFVQLRAGHWAAETAPGAAEFETLRSTMRLRSVQAASTTTTTAAPTTTTTVPPTTTAPPTTTTVPPTTTTVPATSDPLAGTAGPASPTPQVAIPAGWSLRFRDEFSGTSYDTSKWNPSYAHGNGTTVPTSNFYNGELQAYVASQVLVENDSLRLRAEPASPAITAFGDRGDSRSMAYKSGMVISKGSYSAHFAYVEARFKVPGGKGSWPAIWLLDTAGQWPPEIDLMETVNDETDRIHHSLHPTNPSVGKRVVSKVGPNFKDEWHTVGVLWQKTGATTGSVQFYVDGMPSGAAITGTLGELIPDEPMYVLLNLAVGGTWPGSPDATTTFPMDFAVDYVRVWAP